MLTKAEVEARLEQSSASISERIDAIESELPVRPLRLRKLSLKTPAVKLGIALAAGLVVGAIVLRKKGHPADLYREGLDDISAALSKEIRRNVRKGMDTEEAVSEAMRKRPPIVQLGNGGPGVVSTIASQLVRQVLTILGPIIADQFTSRIGTKSEGKK